METTPDSTSTPATPSTQGTMRGNFLTVICILTFIGSGWGLLGAIFGYAVADRNAAITSEAVSNMQTQMNDQNTPSFVKQIFGSMTDRMTPENIKKSALLKILSTLLTLFGGIMMFRQKKIGFYLYIAGIIVLIATPIITIHGIIGYAGAFFAALIGIAFIIMYAVNLKYMDK